MKEKSKNLIAFLYQIEWCLFFFFLTFVAWPFLCHLNVSSVAFVILKMLSSILLCNTDSFVLKPNRIWTKQLECNQWNIVFMIYSPNGHWTLVCSWHSIKSYREFQVAYLPATNLAPLILPLMNSMKHYSYFECHWCQQSNLIYSIVDALKLTIVIQTMSSSNCFDSSSLNWSHLLSLLILFVMFKVIDKNENDKA